MTYLPLYKNEMIIDAFGQGIANAICALSFDRLIF